MQVADSAKAVAEQCDITVAMLADPQAAEAVATGPDGIAAGMSSGDLYQTLFADAVVCIQSNVHHPYAGVAAGKGYVDVSTVDAGTAQKISKVRLHLVVMRQHSVEFKGTRIEATIHST